MAAQDTLRVDVEEKKAAEDANKEPPKRLIKIVNGKNEPAFQLKIVPEHLIFKYCSPVPGFATFTIINTKSDRQAFKVKSHDNEWYRAKPSVGFIKAGEKVHVRVMYLNPNQQPPPPEQHTKHVVVFHVSAGNAKTYKEAFAKKPDGIHHYYCNHLVEMQQVVDDNETDKKN
uniref:Major sperm protein n=1 Tax=Caenorhabditis tropicalis TaxID=1561998 RepID=A0A1I7V516_9PELO